ncbi:MAG: GNAT family N-acetyltransferase [Acidimicrobiales bacterium]|nr:GNAT family N-acetyltransferase [Acidimicrobiales bacterium]
MSNSQTPPENPDEWSDEEWIEWLNATDPEDDEPPHKDLFKRISNSSIAQIMAPGMLGLYNIIYQQQDNQTVEYVMEKPASLHNDIGELIIGSEPDSAVFTPTVAQSAVKFMIDRAEIDDIYDIAKIHVHSFTMGYDDLVDHKLIHYYNFENRVHLWRKLISESSPPKTLSIKLLADQKIAGITHYGPDRVTGNETCEITGFYLHPSFWGMGGGTLLLQGTLEIAKMASYKKVGLWVLSENERAIKFYTKNGFSPDGSKRIENIANVEIEEIRMDFDL